MSDFPTHSLNLQLLLSTVLIAIAATITALNMGLPLWAALPVYSATGTITLLILTVGRYLMFKWSMFQQNEFDLHVHQ